MPNRKPSAVFELIKKAILSHLQKQGEPEVEAVIALLRPSVQAHWRNVVDQAEMDLVAQLEQLEDELPGPDIDALVRAGGDRSRVLQDLVVAFLASLQVAAEQPFGGGLARSVRAATESLLGGGGASLGGGVRLDFARAGAIRQAAQRDLSLMVAGRVNLREAELRRHIADFLTNRDLRRPGRPRGGILGALQGGSLAEWRERLRALLGAQTASWVPFVLDLWAYRWWNAGTILAAEQGGILALQAFNNPPEGPDNKTTPFCNWVHGRVVSTSQAAGKVRRYQRAVSSGDIAAMRAAWPLLTHSVAEGTSRSAFRRGAERVGLPPYHARCRTTLRRL